MRRILAAKIKQPKSPWSKVPPPVIKGDIATVLRSVFEFAKTKDYTASTSLLYDLLLRNSEILPFNPARLQRPESTVDPNEQIQVGEDFSPLSLALFKKKLSAGSEQYISFPKNWTFVCKYSWSSGCPQLVFTNHCSSWLCTSQIWCSS